MKRIHSLFMTAVWCVALALLVCSCDVYKHRNETEKIVKEHHYHDSTYVLETLTIKEITAKPDSTKAYFDLRKLLETGYGKSTDRYFTTEIRYKDSGLVVTTTIDSLISIVKELQRQTANLSVRSQSEISEQSVVLETTKEIKNKIGQFIWSIIILILLIFALYLYWQYKKRNPSPEKS